jgi:Kae1-associated kinase Bud32
MEKQGAEANVKIQEEKVVKERPRKNYRVKELDQRIRQERTEEELKNLERAKKYGVNVPEAEEKDEATIKMEKIPGKTWKEEQNTEKMMEVGENVAKLHSAKIIHGDLTTSNIMTGEKVYLIDFGLSQISERTEDRAVDIHLLKQVLESSHPEKAEEAWKNFLKGYEDFEESEKVLEQLEEVESRGRYK